MDYILNIKDLNKDYKTFSLKNINLQIPQGTVMGFIGANGAGKTTTIKLIMQLIKKDSGNIEIFGRSSKKDFNAIKQDIGFVYDEPCFYEQLKIRDMTKIIASFYGSWDWEVYKNYLSQFKLDENQKIMQLSKGMKTKYSLAVALSHHARLIIMDEPSSGLDPIIRRELLDIFYDVISDGKSSIFFSTHITSDLERIADYITFIKNGEIVFSKRKDDVFSEYSLVKGGLDELKDGIENKLIGIRKTGVGFEALTKEKQGLPSSLIMEKPSLEDIMFFYEKASN
ncbi:ABC transporter ATP-binding protein [Treponema sp. OMZ 789]|nr:ABC transporter ATP-binding protein [Treponema sp. OMZ 789]UTC71196.1 ABC transporter ATP-binding protein [Treponema sp. OMZ 790]UTC73912.1 ABC transporter ATP-binding protein [Treponema sp. OMZ 791]